MKVLVTIGLNRLSTLHIPSWCITPFTVSYFLSEILRIPDNGRNRNLEICYSFFLQETHRDTTELLNPQRKILKYSVKVFWFPTMVEQWRKFCFLEPLKCLFSSFCEYIYNINIGRKTKKINIGRKNTSSQ